MFLFLYNWLNNLAHQSHNTNSDFIPQPAPTPYHTASPLHVKVVRVDLGKLVPVVKWSTGITILQSFWERYLFGYVLPWKYRKHFFILVAHHPPQKLSQDTGRRQVVENLITLYYKHRYVGMGVWGREGLGKGGLGKGGLGKRSFGGLEKVRWRSTGGIARLHHRTINVCFVCSLICLLVGTWYSTSVMTVDHHYYFPLLFS